MRKCTSMQEKDRKMIFAQNELSLIIQPDLFYVLLNAPAISDGREAVASCLDSLTMRTMLGYTKPDVIKCCGKDQ